MTTRRALISGASIAGPALAILLDRTGWEVTLVERAPRIRDGGQAVDFRGDVHRVILEAMGVADAISDAQTGKSDWRLVRSDGSSVAAIPGEFLGGDVEILRGDLARILTAPTLDRCEYRFDDTITRLDERGGGVDVEFERSAPGRFDLVIGADGIHSIVRRLVFGPEDALVRRHGYRYAVAGRSTSAPDRSRQHADLYSEPGRTVIEGSAKAPALFVYRSDGTRYDRHDVASQKRALAAAYDGMGWRTPEIVAAALDADEFLLDELARVDLRGWTRGRVALVGDAAYGNTLSGFGTGLAIVGAWLLAGELSRADGDHRVALPRYDALMPRFVRGTRGSQAGSFLAPPTARGIRSRERVWESHLQTRMYLWFAEHLASRTALPDYPALESSVAVR